MTSRASRLGAGRRGGVVGHERRRHARELAFGARRDRVASQRGRRRGRERACPPADRGSTPAGPTTRGHLHLVIALASDQRRDRRGRQGSPAGGRAHRSGHDAVRPRSRPLCRVRARSRGNGGDTAGLRYAKRQTGASLGYPALDAGDDAEPHPDRAPQGRARVVPTGRLLGRAHRPRESTRLSPLRQRPRVTRRRAGGDAARRRRRLQVRERSVSGTQPATPPSSSLAGILANSVRPGDLAVRIGGRRVRHPARRHRASTSPETAPRPSSWRWSTSPGGRSIPTCRSASASASRRSPRPGSTSWLPEPTPLSTGRRRPAEASRYALG